jgi:DNA-directed RNA polymerase specialized sigma24 family protein
MLTSKKETNISSLISTILSLKDNSQLQKKAFDLLLKKTVSYLPKTYYQNFNLDDIQEAKSLTLMAICGCDRQNSTSSKNLRNLVKSCQVNPGQLERYYLQWVRKIFRYKLIDLLRKNNRHFYLSLDDSIAVVEVTLSSLDQLIEQEEKDLDQAIIAYLKADPEGILIKCYPQGYPQSNAKELVKLRLLQNKPQKWQDIASDFNTPFGTITSHWNRKCLPLLRQIANQLQPIAVRF